MKEGFTFLIVWWLCFSCFVIASSYESSDKTCTSYYCNPNWTPYKNMVHGLQGYNIIRGNPIRSNGDPGFTHQIFIPTKRNKRGEITLEDGITAHSNLNCRKTLTSRSFTNINNYRKFLERTSRSGRNLQIGLERTITAGVNIKGMGVSVKKVIPPIFRRAWSNSKDFRSLKTLFTKKQGIVVVNMGKCILYDMKLDRNRLPSFTKPFIRALGDLYDNRRRSAHRKKRSFQNFINDYGTHFLLKSKFGAQYILRTKYTKRVRNKMKATTLQRCSRKKGFRFFYIQFEKDSSRCTRKNERDLQNFNSFNFETDVITKGSRPTSIKKWVVQKFKPVPLEFELSPIVNLFQSKYIDNRRLKTRRGNLIRSKEIRKWFLPLYMDFCKSMNIKCKQNEHGCGINDKCPIDTICTGSGKYHFCTAWSSWTGPNKQYRKRTCSGCKGQTRQFRKKTCNDKICCEEKHTRYTPSRDIYSLTNHHVNCGQGRTIQEFRIVWSSILNKLRFKYKCCDIAIPCVMSRRDTATTIVGNGLPVYLDRQHPRCPQYMSGFEIRRYGNNIYFSLECCTIKETVATTKRKYFENPFTINGGPYGKVFYLDRQRVQCGCAHSNSWGLSNFGLIRSGMAHWSFKYQCVRAAEYKK